MLICGQGRDAAQIMLIGDWGLKEDLVQGVALSGACERTLGTFFKVAGYDVRNTYRTLLIKDILSYDGKSKNLKKKSIDEAFASAKVRGIDYYEIIKNEILQIRPNIIVPMGDLALRFISGYSPITAYRGSVLPLNPLLQSQIKEKSVRVIGTFSPRATWENYTSRVYVQLDFNKIVKLRERTDEIEPVGTIWVCRRIEAFRNYLERHRDIMQRPIKDRFCTVDIETYLGFPTAIGFCFDGKEAVSIPLVEEKVDYANAFLLFLEIAKMLDSIVPKVNQNIKFDWTILERFGFRLSNIAGDTSLGFHLLYPELPKNLGFQTSIYTDLPYFKDESSKKDTAWNPKSYTRDSLYLYNAKDALATWQIHRAQQDEMEETGVLNLYTDRIIPLITIYKNIDDRGIRVDKAVRRALITKYRTLYDATTIQFMSRMMPLVKYDSMEEAQKVLRSPQKLGDLIFNILKYPPRYKTTEGGKKNFQTDKDTLDGLMILYGESNKLKADGRRILGYIIACRKITGVLNYLKTPLHLDGTFRSSYNLAGTETGRTSASKTIDSLLEVDAKGKLIWPMKKIGRSLQTITKHGFDIDGELYDAVGDERLGSDLRSMYIPRKGYYFGEGDLSQAEARVVAVLAEDFELLASFDQKPKIHAKTAALIFGVDANTITSSWPVIPDIGMTYYDLGKRARHAGNYNMGGFRLAQMTHIDIEQCREILIIFHAANPKIRGVFHADVYEQLKKTQTLTTPFRRTRQFFERLNDTTVKKGYAHIPQSTVSDQVKFSFPAIRRRAPWAPLVYEGHDAAMAEIPIGREKEFRDIFKEEVEKPINFSRCSLSRDYDLSIPCEFHIGEKNWQEMVELKD